MSYLFPHFQNLVSRSKKKSAKIVVASFVVFSGFNYYTGSEKFYEKILMPAVTVFNSKHAEGFMRFVNKYRLTPKSRYRDPKSLQLQISSLCFSNPIGLSPGLDTKAEALKSLSNVGFSFVEIGSIQPTQIFDDDPQSNQSLSQTFNSHKNDQIIKRIVSFREQNKVTKVGINLERSPNSVNNTFIEGVKKFAPVVDFLVINLENRTKDFFNDEDIKQIGKLIPQILKARTQAAKTPPLILLKVPSDMSSMECRFLGNILCSKHCQVDGVIVKHNAEVNREIETIPMWPIKNVNSSRGTSSIISEMYQVTKGKIPIIVDGGVTTGQDAYEKIKQGACLIQVYEPLIQYGPPRITRIKKDLNQLLEEDGFENVSNAVGYNFKQKNKHYFFPFY